MTNESNALLNEETYVPEYPAEAVTLATHPDARWIVGCELEYPVIRVFYIVAGEYQTARFLGEGPTLEAAWESAAERVNLNRPSNEAEAALAAQGHALETVERGKALLDRMPPNPTYENLRNLIWEDQARINGLEQ